MSDARFGLCALAAWILTSSPGLTGFYLMMALVGVAGSRKSATVTYRRRVAKVVSREGVALEGLMRASIRDRGLHWTSDGGEGTINWPLFKKLYESDRLYVLGFRGVEVMPIPKESVSGDAASFVSEIRMRSAI